MSVKTKVKLFGAITVFLAVTAIYYFRVTEAVLDMGDTAVSSYLTTAVYLSEMDNLGKTGYGYSDFFKVVHGSDGYVSAFFTDGAAINSFTSAIALSVNEKLAEYAKKGVDIPSGVLSGIRIFSGYGKKINVKLLEITSVNCRFESEFTSAGINQVKHSLYLVVSPNAELKAVGRSRSLTVSVSVPVFENVFVGKIPDFYIN